MHFRNVLNYFHDILPRWRKHFPQLLDVHRFNEVRQTELHTTEPLLTEPIAFHVELDIEELNSHKSPGIVQIPAELINP